MLPPRLQQLVLSILYCSAVAPTAHAAATAIEPLGQVGSGGGAEDIFLNAYDKVLGVVTLLAGGLATVFVIYYGIQYIASAGDVEKTKKARGNVVNAILGVIIITAAYLIIHYAQAIGVAVRNTL